MSGSEAAIPGQAQLPAPVSETGLGPTALSEKDLTNLAIHADPTAMLQHLNEKIPSEQLSDKALNDYGWAQPREEYPQGDKAATPLTSEQMRLIQSMMPKPSAPIAAAHLPARGGPINLAPPNLGVSQAQLPLSLAALLHGRG